MDAFQFNQSNDTQKIEAVLKGTFLADRLSERHYIKLYNIDHFYAEVFFDDRTHLITHLRAFKNTSLLTPYLEEFKLRSNN